MERSPDLVWKGNVPQVRAMDLVDRGKERMLHERRREEEEGGEMQKAAAVAVAEAVFQRRRPGVHGGSRPCRRRTRMLR